MEITSDLGREVIDRLSEYIEVDINIIDLAGKIVASTDASRLNEIHSGAIKVIEKNEAVILKDNDMGNFPGTKPGVNLPIMLQDRIKGVVGVSGNPDEISQVAGIIRASVEIALEQIYIQRQTYFKERQWSHWIHQLLHPYGFDEVQLVEDAVYSLKIEPQQSWRIILLAGDNSHSYLEAIRQEIAGESIKTLFILPFKESEIVIAISPGFNRINKLVGQFIEHSNGSIRAGIGNAEFGIKGIRDSYKQAKQSLAFAKNGETIADIDSYKIERLTFAISQAEYDSICKRYEHLLDEIGKENLKTIELYLRMDFKIKETADLLHIHRNTLLYRLDQIKEKIVLDPRSFNDAFILKVIMSRNI